MEATRLAWLRKIHIALFTIILQGTILVSAAHAKCTELSQEDVRRILEYLTHAARASAKIGAAEHQFKISESKVLDTSCYTRIVVNEQGSTAREVLFVSPDHQYLTPVLWNVEDDLEALQQAEWRKTSHLLDDPESSTLGPKDAPVTLVIFEDFQCPYCNRLEGWVQLLPSEIARNLRIVSKNYPLSIHPLAVPEAKMAICAFRQGDKAYSGVRKFLFDNQSDLSFEQLLGGASAAGGFEEKQKEYRNCVQSGETDKLLERERALADSLKVTRTPTMYLNGRPLTRLYTYKDLETAIKQELVRGSGQPGKPAE